VESRVGQIASHIIMIWKGLVSAIPSGWVLCDGNNSTPDLRGKFIKGAQSGDEGGSGGSTTLTHSGTAVTSHPVTTTSQASAGATQRGTAASTVTLLAHTHNTPILAHTVTQPNDHTNVEPVYWKLAYIMKV